VFAGISVLFLVSTFLDSLVRETENFQAAKDVSTFRDTLLDLFGRIEHFFVRLEIYTTVPPTPVMTGIIVEIVVEVLSFLAFATKEIKRGRTSELPMDYTLFSSDVFFRAIFEETDRKHGR
jgi:hypothetical protein